MPFDPTAAFAVGVAFLSLIAILIYSFWYQTFKHKHKNPRTGSDEEVSSSVSISELEAMMRKVVGEVTRSLEQRLTALETEIGSPSAGSDEEDRRMLAEHRQPISLIQNEEASEVHDTEAARDRGSE